MLLLNILTGLEEAEAVDSCDVRTSSSELSFLLLCLKECLDTCDVRLSSFILSSSSPSWDLLSFSSSEFLKLPGFKRGNNLEEWNETGLIQGGFVLISNYQQKNAWYCGLIEDNSNKKCRLSHISTNLLIFSKLNEIALALANKL